MRKRKKVNLKGESVANDEAIIDGDGYEARIGGETTGPSLLVAFSELHRSQSLNFSQIHRSNARLIRLGLDQLLFLIANSVYITFGFIRSGFGSLLPETESERVFFFLCRSMNEWNLVDRLSLGNLECGFKF